MASQVQNGKAFEWAAGMALQEHGLALIKNNASDQNAACFSGISSNQKITFTDNSLKAVAHILAKENIAGGDFVFLGDDNGKQGDVRDIVIFSQGREIGLSCKTNHAAFKHSRLSDKSDFMKAWGLSPNGCSDEYKQAVARIFGQLRHIKKTSHNSATWRDLPNVPQEYYWPALDAFADEITRHETSELCQNFIKYIVGNKDFYKIISRKKAVTVEAFNLSGTLRVPVAKLPTAIDSIKSKNGSQYAKTIIFNHGWTFNFRIHNASSRVEPSLKFDIQAISHPCRRHYISTIYSTETL